MENTYAWMMATAISKIINIVWNNIIIINIIFMLDVALSPSSLINKCPAIIFAINRTARAPGRIIFLIVSIHTINGISTVGVPVGIKWASISWDLFIHPNIINLIHMGKASDSVYIMCLDLVNT